MSDPAEFRRHFLGWQCRIRQHAMRKAEGRPSPGMRPRVLTGTGHEIAAAITILLVPKEPAESTDFLRHQVRKTHDPRLIYERGLNFLQATHFQNAASFSDLLTALFPGGSRVAATLIAAGECMLEFEQFNQTYRMICAVGPLAHDDEAFQATVWHNRIFNPATSDDAVVLGFRPDWRSAQADPSP